MISNSRPLFLSFAAGLVAGCLDMSPLDYQPLDLSFDAGASIMDRSASDAPSITSTPECDDCLFFSYPSAGQPGCAGESAACFANAQCKAVVLCAVRSPCLLIPDETARNICLVPCATDAGISAFSDPAVALAFPVLTCSATCPACSVQR